MTTRRPWHLPYPTLPAPTPPPTRADLDRLVAAAQERHANRLRDAA